MHLFLFLLACEPHKMISSVKWIIRLFYKRNPFYLDTILHQLYYNSTHVWNTTTYQRNLIKSINSVRRFILYRSLNDAKSRAFTRTEKSRRIPNRCEVVRCFCLYALSCLLLDTFSNRPQGPHVPKAYLWFLNQPALVFLPVVVL